jgi:hypothetical protein
MNKLIFTIMIFAGMASAMSDPKWVQVTSDSTTSVYVDANHVDTTIGNQQVKLWTKYVYSSKQLSGYQHHTLLEITSQDGPSTIVKDSVTSNTIWIGDNGSYSYDNERILSIYDCRYHRVISIMLLRDQQQKLVYSVGSDWIPNNYATWGTIVPGTYGANVYNYVCPDDAKSYKTNEVPSIK